MRFFSKIVAVCNLCFILSSIMRLIEIPMRKAGSKDGIIPLPFVEGTIVVLGFIVAILLNSAFVFIVLYRKSIRKGIPVHRYILWFNIIMLPIEIWYSFFKAY
ncbi:hypothetical protein ACFOWM_13755 [Ferruginibacter yonginensis]|uniref:Uncharacterized protein n=1 Tax=Ferruginibacter yonginensis TaxID=1310416 RepID=A0ABV8QY93_9BACT